MAYDGGEKSHQYRNLPTTLAQRSIGCNDQYRVITITHQEMTRVASFSPTEYQLLLVLLDGRFHPNKGLIGCIQGSLRTLYKHVYNLNGKLRPLGLKVCRLTKYGYVVLPLEEGEKEEISRLRVIAPTTS